MALTDATPGRARSGPVGSVAHDGHASPGSAGRLERRRPPPLPLLRHRSRRHGRRDRRALLARRRLAVAGLLRCAAMRALVVHADPSPDGLSASLFDTATTTLRRCGHEVAALDLYAEHFAPAMSAEERRAYLTDSPICSEQVARHAELVRWADTLVFVYPTWWAGPPAALKGWLERVLVPGVAFHLDERTNKVVSDLRHVRAVVGISTYHSSWATVRLCTTAAAASSCGHCACCARGPAGRGGWRSTRPTPRPRPGGRPSGPGSSRGSRGCERPVVNVLLVSAHPLADSYTAAVRAAAISGLEAAGHVVDVADLDAERFDPCPRETSDVQVPRRPSRVGGRAGPRLPHMVGRAAGHPLGLARAGVDRRHRVQSAAGGAACPAGSAQHPPPGGDHDAWFVEVDQRGGGRTGQAGGAAPDASLLPPEGQDPLDRPLRSGRLGRGRAAGLPRTGRAVDGRAGNGHGSSRSASARRREPRS